MNKGNIVYTINSKYSTFGIIKAKNHDLDYNKALVNWCNGNNVAYNKAEITLADKDYISTMLKKYYDIIGPYFKITKIKEMLDGYKR